MFAFVKKRQTGQATLLQAVTKCGSNSASILIYNRDHRLIDNKIYKEIADLSYSPTLASILNKTAFVLFAAGAACTGLFLAATIDARVTSHAAENAFNEFRRLQIELGPDQALWSPAQRERYEQSLSKYLIAPPAMMRIPAVDVSVPVYGGATELELNRGVGWIEGTAELGAEAVLHVKHVDGTLAIGGNLRRRNLQRQRIERAGDGIEEAGPVAAVDLDHRVGRAGLIVDDDPWRHGEHAGS